jgi:predicted DNA-binding transcriptional regulator AlpA
VLIKLASVVQITRLPEATIRRWERNGENDFPAALRLGKRQDRYWDDAAVREWVIHQDGQGRHFPNTPPVPSVAVPQSECEHPSPTSSGRPDSS